VTILAIMLFMGIAPFVVVYLIIPQVERRALLPALMRFPIAVLAVGILVMAGMAIAQAPAQPVKGLPSTGNPYTDIGVILGAIYGVIQAIAYLLTVVLPDGSKGWNIAKHVLSGPPRPPPEEK
jgi:heme/copper-type cytochrome/quinol oxidase subunit 3